MKRRCSSCGRLNRIPARHLADRGRCGACKAALEPVGEPLEVGSAEFDVIVGEADVPVLVDFWAPWCGPCRMAAPNVQTAAARLRGSAIVLKVDTDAHPDLARRFNIRGIPTFGVFKGGRLAQQRSGVMSAGDLERFARDA